MSLLMRYINPAMEEESRQIRLSAEEQSLPYVRCKICREKLHCADDFHYADQAYNIDGYWVCEDCIHTLKEDVHL